MLSLLVHFVGNHNYIFEAVRGLLAFEQSCRTLLGLIKGTTAVLGEDALLDIDLVHSVTC